MTTLVDYQIRNMCRDMGLVEPFVPEMINPASIDVTLGETILTEGRICGPEKDRKRWIERKIDDNYYLPPGHFILAHTAEYIRVPNNFECIFALKSSRGREGLNHALAAYIDPGFHGRVTLELHNMNCRHSIHLHPGKRIGQLRFQKLGDVPMRSYAVTGRYHGDESVTPSKG